MLSVNVLTMSHSQQQKDVKQHVTTTTGEPEGCQRVIRRGGGQREKPAQTHLFCHSVINDCSSSIEILIL